MKYENTDIVCLENVDWRIDGVGRINVSANYLNTKRIKEPANTDTKGRIYSEMYTTDTANSVIQASSNQIISVYNSYPYIRDTSLGYGTMRISAFKGMWIIFEKRS